MDRNTDDETAAERRRYSCALLDLDGTLVDSLPGITRALADAIASLGHELPDEQTMRLFVGPPLEHTFRHTLGFSEAETQRAITVYRTDFDLGVKGNPLFPGIKEMLENLQTAGLPLALATSKPEPLARKILEKQGLAHLFAVICGSGSDEKNSEKVQVIGKALAALQRQGVETTAGVMVGDRIYDAEGATAHGLPTITVRWGYAPEEELRKMRGYGPEVCSTAELTRLLLATEKAKKINC